ncbi:MAG TPA: caspase family protein [Ktedonobacteraceae bacterium]|nr:caspase family protein [Ktedonobacteraceae bacterium]
MGKRLGLIIGINSYHDPTFRPLNYAENDARALAQWLVNNRGGNWNPPDVQLLLGEQANSKLAETLIIQSCVSVADQNDLVFIYFAGHTFLDETTGEGYLAFVNTHVAQPSSAISLYSLFNGPVQQSRAAQIVLVIDGFQIGPAWSRRRSSPFDFKPLLGPMSQNNWKQAQGRLLYCSCRGNEYAPEVGEKNFGKLLYHMIIGLSGPANDPLSGQATLQSLHAFLLNSLDEQHQPQVFGLEHRPIVIAGEMPSFSNKQERISVSPLSAPLQSSPMSSQATNNQAPEYLSQSAIGIANAQMSPITSGLSSIEILEQNRRNQCLKLLNQAQQQVQLQNIPAALNSIENILLIAPDFVDALILKAQLLGSTGYLQDALAAANQVVKLDPGNALGWSICATLHANMGQLHEASTAIDQSLALSPNNSEALALRDAIHTNLARNSLLEQDAKAPSSSTTNRNKGSAKSFLIGAVIQFTALFVGIIGASILVVRPQLPIIVAFLLESFSLAILCVNAARGAYFYGIKHFMITCVSSLLTLGILGALYRFGYHWLINRVIALPPLIVPVLFLGFWLITAAILPLLIALVALITGIITGVRRNHS